MELLRQEHGIHDHPRQILLSVRLCHMHNFPSTPVKEQLNYFKYILVGCLSLLLLIRLGCFHSKKYLSQNLSVSSHSRDMNATWHPLPSIYYTRTFMSELIQQITVAE